MKFPISLSVTSVNPDTDLPQTKLCFLYVTECHKHFSCLLYHFNTQPPLLWLYVFFIISVSPLSISLLYMFYFQAWAMLISVSASVLEKEQETALTAEKKRTRKGGQPKHQYMGEFSRFIYVSYNIFILIILLLLSEINIL